MNLRPAQIEVLKYRQGRMAVSAVPGSGKTFTLALLAADLLASKQVDIKVDQQVLIVTYLNASVDTFRARIRQGLEERNLPLLGYDVRTLHSLAMEIIRLASGNGGPGQELAVADEVQTNHFIARAVGSWIEANPNSWHGFFDNNSLQQVVRWKGVTENTARAFIRVAKNSRYKPESVFQQIGRHFDETSGISMKTFDRSGRHDQFDPALLWMMAGIYRNYQSILERQAALDFDDLVWMAVELLETRIDLVEALQRRWPYVLEDEAQDSIPFQEILLSLLTGPAGNWVRVGDPNQAITSTFTAAHPRFFADFLNRADVTRRPLPNSGRCAPLIFNAANTLVKWTCDHHPVPEVRRHAFHRQEILPTPDGDAQPNPRDDEADITIRVFNHREEEELPTVAQGATLYARENPGHTIAILVSTNQIGRALAEHLDILDADYDDLLRGGNRQREIAAAIHALLRLLSDPLDNRALLAAFTTLEELNHPLADLPGVDGNRFQTLLRSIFMPELIFFPINDGDFISALPADIFSESEIDSLWRLTKFFSEAFQLRALPVDDMVLGLGDRLFTGRSGNPSALPEGDLTIVYQIAYTLRRWQDLQPEWRLPELVAQLADVAEGRRYLQQGTNTQVGYKPTPGRITLATQHSAKGMEWDVVYLVGMDGFWIPGDLDAPFLGVEDFLGGDPAAEVSAQLRFVMEGHSGLFEGRTATESAHIEVINERLRLLYVGITRARRRLVISRSRKTRRYHREHTAEPATAMAVIYDYLSSRSLTKPAE